MFEHTLPFLVIDRVNNSLLINNIQVFSPDSLQPIMDSFKADPAGILPSLGSASLSWSPSNPHKRIYHEFMRSLNSNDASKDYNRRTTKKRKKEQTLGVNFQTIQHWATKHKEVVKIVSVGGHPSLPQWGAEITMLQKCFKTEMVFFKKRARREALDLLCWWVFYGRPLEEAGVVSFV